MALLLCDSFDHYTTITDKWTAAHGSASIGASYGRLGTAGLRLPKGDNGVSLTLPASNDHIIVGQAIHFEDVTNTHVLLTLIDDATVQVQVRQEGANFKVYRNATEIHSVAHGMVAGFWYYLEIKVVIGDSGNVTIRVDATEVMNETEDTQETGNAYCTKVALGGMTDAGASSYTYRDDVVIMDDSGSYCNAFLGDVLVQAISPTSAGANTDWTPSAGDNYQCVDEKPPSTADYVESASPNDIDTYTTENVSPLTGDVYAMVVNHYSQKTGSAARGVSGIALDTGTATVGTENTLDASYKMRQSMMYVNQRTSSPFTIADVNNAEFGVKLTT